VAVECLGGEEGVDLCLNQQFLWVPPVIHIPKIPINILVPGNFFEVKTTEDERRSNGQYRNDHNPSTPHANA
jgi:hypothetical protein